VFPTVDDDEEGAAASGFECHICLDIAKDAGEFQDQGDNVKKEYY
jgi:hypothetical protein